jgi:hypothetical protein
VQREMDSCCRANRHGYRGTLPLRCWSTNAGMASLSSSAASAASFPDVVGVPAQGDHFRYYWDGCRITYARKITGDRSIVAL